MPSLKSVVIRADDSGKYLSVKKENSNGDKIVKAKSVELDLSEKIKDKYLWVIDTYHGIIRSAKDYNLCLDYDNVPFYCGSSSSDSSSDEDYDSENKTSLVVREFDADCYSPSQQWRIDTRRNVIALKDSKDVIDLTSDKNRVCVWEYHGGAHQLFSIIPTEYDVPTFKIVDVHTDRVMSVREDGTVVLADDEESLSSVWVCGNNMIIRPMFNPNYVMSVEAGYLTIEEPVSGNYYQGWTLNLYDDIICQCKPDILLKCDEETGKIITFNRDFESDEDYHHFSIIHY